MQVTEEKLLEITKLDNFNEALNLVFNDYLKYKLFLKKNENNRYEVKWGMSFDEFEKKSPQMPNRTSYELEQEYYTWEAIITEMEYLKKISD